MDERETRHVRRDFVIDAGQHGLVRLIVRLWYGGVGRERVIVETIGLLFPIVQVRFLVAASRDGRAK